MKILQAMPEETRATLRGNLHKVAAVMARAEGIPLARDEITLKEAAFLIGTKAYQHYLEKRAIFDGIINVMKLERAEQKRG